MTWASSAPEVLKAEASGLVTASALGLAAVSATLSNVTGSSNMTAIFAPLTVVTGVVPNGALDVDYHWSLEARGGKSFPYRWALESGALPAGLILDANTGELTGRPEVAGTATFSVSVTDSGNPGERGSGAIELQILTNLPVSLWTEATVGGLVDQGPDNPVELGVKFRADVDGMILGIQFYKSAANLGTHVGNLWSSTGTRLGTATFTDETASGWQQVNFATPVAVTANTIYVASYHCPGGHYTEDRGYFAYKGKDHPPLHALQSEESGGNGVYAYGTGSGFPDVNSANSSNYYVDVLFQAGPPPALRLTLSMPHQTPAEIGSTGLRLRISVNSPGDYLIQRSSDLILWEDLIQVHYTDTELEITDSETAGASRLFYRATRQ